MVGDSGLFLLYGFKLALECGGSRAYALWFANDCAIKSAGGAYRCPGCDVRKPSKSSLTLHRRRACNTQPGRANEMRGHE